MNGAMMSATSRLAMASAVGILLSLGSAKAADLGGNCCAGAPIWLIRSDRLSPAHSTIISKPALCAAEILASPVKKKRVELLMLSTSAIVLVRTESA